MSAQGGLLGPGLQGTRGRAHNGPARKGPRGAHKGLFCKDPEGDQQEPGPQPIRAQGATQQPIRAQRGPLGTRM